MRLCFKVSTNQYNNNNDYDYDYDYGCIQDFAIENSIFCSIKDQTNLRFQSERSTS